MADFKRVIITRDGQKLMSDIIAGKKTLSFTRLIISEDDVAIINDKATSGENSADEGIKLNYFATINQETPELQVHTVESLAGMSNPSVEVIASVDNTQLTKGYYMKTLGLCAEDNGGNEILYAYTYADQPGYMPPYNGKTTSGAMFKITVTVGNADQVNLLQGVGYASSYEVDELRQQLNDVQTIVGYNNGDVYGLEADFENNQFTRLAGASNLTAGKDFDNIGPWKRKRCMIDYKTGNVVAYEGDPNFSESGKLAKPVTVNSGTYSTDNEYAVMVEQPKFYYRVVPIKTTNVDNDTVLLDKARYYVSSTPHIGFKVHPAFIVNGDEVDKIYLSSYTSSLMDVNGQQSRVLASRNTNSISASINNLGGYLNNTRAINSSWNMEGFNDYALMMLLYIIEYGKFNARALNTNELMKYRGEYGLHNGSVFFDLAYNMLDGEVRIVKNGSITCRFTPAPKGYISRFMYADDYDWAFYPAMNKGTSIAPVGSSYDFSLKDGLGFLLSTGNPFGVEIVNGNSSMAYSSRLVYKHI